MYEITPPAAALGRVLLGFEIVCKQMSANRIVALVEDDPAVLASLKFVLEMDGHTVAAYSSASAFLEDEATDAACLIADQHMPEITGLDLATRLRAAGSKMPILLVTGAPSPTIVARAAQLGIKVLDKPPDEGDIITFISSYT